MQLLPLSLTAYDAEVYCQRVKGQGQGHVKFGQVLNLKTDGPTAKILILELKI